MTTHTLIATCPFAYEGVEVEITYNFTPERGPTGRSYASGGEPGYAAEVELIGVRPVDRDLILPVSMQRDLSDWADTWIADEGYEMACDRAADDDERARESAADRRRE